jgi:hypothetical protein
VHVAKNTQRGKTIAGKKKTGKIPSAQLLAAVSDMHFCLTGHVFCLAAKTSFHIGGSHYSSKNRIKNAYLACRLKGSSKCTFSWQSLWPQPFLS